MIDYRYKLSQLILAVIFFCSTAFTSNAKFQKKFGRVSFITTQNIYVKFENTEGITKGDTVNIEQTGKAIPILIIKYISSQSCAGEKIGKFDLKVGDNVFANVKEKEPELRKKETAGTEIDSNIVRAGNKQKSITAEVSTRISSSIFFNLYYEGDFGGKTTYGRFMSGINYRF